VLDWKSVDHNKDFQQTVIGSEIINIDRVGKYLFLSLNKEDLYVIGHLKMTGRMIYQAADDDTQYGGGHSLSGDLLNQPHKHTRIIYTFVDGSHLYFNDMRKFGYMKLAKESEVMDQKAALGPEPGSKEYSVTYLSELMSDRKTTVKAALLNQRDIAGLGNIYVDEACWRAEIRPQRIAGKLSDNDIDKLHTATCSILQDAVMYGGTTFRDYTDTDGQQGNFSDELKVFARQGKKCPRCGEVIKKDRVAGRGTHFCPGCQL
jgi:formamidopyrimidine-DNA glycosylase